MIRLPNPETLDDNLIQCPRCAKRLTAETTTCPSCGYVFLPHRERIRCNRCGKRIPADATQCPHCQGDPRATRVSPRAKRIILIATAILLLMCVGWVTFRAITTNTLARALGLNEPTRVPTQVLQIIYVIATQIPPSPTLAIPTAIPTPRFSPTPTRKGARVTPPPATVTLTPPMYPAPQLAAPANTTVYAGIETNIVLEWQPVSALGLRENEWYMITLAFTGRDNAPTERKLFSKEPRWAVPNTWWNEISADARTVKWNVTIMRVEGIDPFASPTRVAGSPLSATRSFIWN